MITFREPRAIAAALIRCMDTKDQAAAEALVTRLWYQDRRLFDEVLSRVWRIEAARAVPSRRPAAVTVIPVPEPARRHLVAAVAVPARKPGRRWRPEELRPCGTEAAYDRHLARKEVACGLCCEAERVRKERQRAGQRARAAAWVRVLDRTHLAPARARAKAQEAAREEAA